MQCVNLDQILDQEEKKKIAVKTIGKNSIWTVD